MDSEDIQKYKQSGIIAAKALKYGCSMIKPGFRLLDVCDKVEEKIKELGGLPAFPVQTSVNDIAAHYCPEEDDVSVYKEGDMVKLDVGVHMGGFVSDNAASVDLGDNNDLLKASREAVDAALKIAKIGTTLGEMGRAIQAAIEKYGFAPVKNLSGHGIGEFTVHSPPSIPNFDTGSDHVLQDGMAIAIEPFASKGAGMIYESANPTVFMQLARKPIRSQFARLILKDIQGYNGLPFTTRWLSRIHGIGKTKFGLRELINAGIIKAYPPLPDVKHGLISQAEHSVLILDKPIVITKID